MIWNIYKLGVSWDFEIMENLGSINEPKSNSKQTCIKVDFANPHVNLALRRKLYDITSILMIEIKIEENIYKKGPCQSIHHNFLHKQFQKIMCWFSTPCFNEHAT